jgi:hypothetical protein
MLRIIFSCSYNSIEELIKNKETALKLTSYLITRLSIDGRILEHELIIEILK